MKDFSGSRRQISVFIDEYFDTLSCFNALIYWAILLTTIIPFMAIALYLAIMAWVFNGWGFEK